jgi:hypothetical protein
MQFCLWVGLANFPKGRQEMDRIAQKAKIQHHDFFGVTRPFKKI